MAPSVATYCGAHSSEGSARLLSEVPDEMIKRWAITCPRCAADFSGQTQTCCHRYDHIDIAQMVTRVELRALRRLRPALPRCPAGQQDLAAAHQVCARY